MQVLNALLYFPAAFLGVYAMTWAAVSVMLNWARVTENWK